jgi:hypothetical protein
MLVQECDKNLLNFMLIMEMAKDHPNPPYDCSFREFKEVFIRLFMSPDFKSWILYSPGNEPAGYIVTQRIDLLTPEIIIFDAFLKPDYRGRKNILLFWEEVKKWAIKENLKVRWLNRSGSKTWSRLLHLPISEQFISEWRPLNE